MTRERISGETSIQDQLRRLRRDVRQDENKDIVGYQSEDGQGLAWTGDDDAPYVKLAGTITPITIAEPVDINDLPPTTAAAGNSLTLSRSTALENDRIVKLTSGTLYAMRASLNAASATHLWLQLFNINIAPVLGEVPIWSAALPAGAIEVSEEIPWGFWCSAGIVLGISSTHLTYTSAGDLAVFQAAYR